MDLLSAIYATLAILAFYEWLQKHGNSADFMLGLTFLSILSYVKNDGFVVYMTGILGALILYCIIHWKHVKEKIQLFRTPTSWLYIIAIILFFIAPFTFIKSYYGLGFNQAAGADAGLGLASSIHWEIFPAIRKTIWTMNNYSIAPVLFIVVMLWMLIRRKHIRREQLFLALSPLAILGIFLLVFLLTENYKFVLDQTTVNRVFTMVLVIFFSSFGLLLNQPKE